MLTNPHEAQCPNTSKFHRDSNSNCTPYSKHESVSIPSREKRQYVTTVQLLLIIITER